MIPIISSALSSQTIGRRTIADLLIYLGRTAWMQNYNTHQLTIEVWSVGIWVKQAGIISYYDLAEWIRETTKLKASALQVQRDRHLFLVQGSQQPWYEVVKTSDRYGQLTLANGLQHSEACPQFLGETLWRLKDPRQPRQPCPYQCECMLWRCRYKRLSQELPQLFEALNRQIFCHHTVAASNFDCLN
jgi:hypothetical protein